MNSHYTTTNSCAPIALSEIPVLHYAQFFEEISERMGSETFHCVNYFGVPSESGAVFYFIGADDATGEIYVWAWEQDYYADDTLPSLTARHHALHPFEREITEMFGIGFQDNPYNKPLRFAHDRADRSRTMETYPFYSIPGHSVHEVNVGPIHAGIIEPGAFRFICNGEKILHMEVVLGYQHRGVEKLITATENMLRRNVLTETIAGDTAIGHTTAFAHAIEGLTGFSDKNIDVQRTIAAELERVAMHIADTGALCTDVGYQLGQVACEALRTIIINTTQRWCGNRFGKGLVRVCGSNHPLTCAKAELMLDNIKDVRRRFEEVCNDIYTTPSVLSRFEDCGNVSRRQSLSIGMVGMASRASGVARDVRASHPYGNYRELKHSPVVMEGGDVMSRGVLRFREVQQSVEYIIRLVQDFSDVALPVPDYSTVLAADSMVVSLTEGWRGEICHVAVTDGRGQLKHYKIKDPSLHNWYGLSLAVRGAGISDFPINNKSFNLSYCGYDL